MEIGNKSNYEGQSNSMFFFICGFPIISVSPASKKFLQLPSSRTNVGRLWNSMETGGTCCPVQTAAGTPSRGWKKHLPSFTKNSGANHHWHRIWGLTISLRWQQIAVRFLKKWWWFHADTFICRGCILLWCQKKNSWKMTIWGQNICRVQAFHIGKGLFFSHVLKVEVWEKKGVAHEEHP